MASVTTDITDARLREVMCNLPGVGAEVSRIAQQTAARANALGAGFKTERVTDWKTKQEVGGTAPVYGSDAQKRDTWVGIVYTDNYAARKDCLLHNTLLKARG